MNNYKISDNTDTITVEASNIKDALSNLSWDATTALEVSDGDTEYYIVWHPGTPDTDEEVGDDPRFEIVVGYGPIETDWLPIWQRQ